MFLQCMFCLLVEEEEVTLQARGMRHHVGRGTGEACLASGGDVAPLVKHSQNKSAKRRDYSCV